MKPVSRQFRNRRVKSGTPALSGEMHSTVRGVLKKKTKWRQGRQGEGRGYSSEKNRGVTEDVIDREERTSRVGRARREGKKVTR